MAYGLVRKILLLCAYLTSDRGVSPLHGGLRLAVEEDNLKIEVIELPAADDTRRGNEGVHVKPQIAGAWAHTCASVPAAAHWCHKWLPWHN